jgi:hypothetical protein
MAETMTGADREEEEIENLNEDDLADILTAHQRRRHELMKLQKIARASNCKVTRLPPSPRPKFKFKTRAASR